MQDLTFELTVEFINFLSLMESNESEKPISEMVASENDKQVNNNCSGNCLEAMRHLLYGSVGFHGKIREQAVTYIDDNRSTFQDAVVACLSCPHNSMATIRK